MVTAVKRGGASEEDGAARIEQTRLDLFGSQIIAWITNCRRQ